MREPIPARLHIIAAKEAPIAVVIRRKPSKKFHIMRWNLVDNTTTHGSWFSGKLYPLRSDVAWDGKYFSYLAVGSGGNYHTWNGICELPFLKTVVEWDNCGTYNGGAVWMKRNLVYRNLALDADVRFMGDWSAKTRFARLPGNGHGEDLSIIFHRLYRDGYRPQINGKKVDPLDSGYRWINVNPSETGIPWVSERRTHSVRLIVRYVGYGYDSKGQVLSDEGWSYDAGVKGRSGYLLTFELEGFGDVLGKGVEWATWSSSGDLLYAQKGCLHRISPEGLVLGRRPTIIDLNDIEPPPKRDAIGSDDNE